MSLFKARTAPFAFASALLVHVSLSAFAAPADHEPPIPPDATLLNISATGVVRSSADNLVAIMTAEERGKNVASVQKQVNATIQKAIQIATDSPTVHSVVKNYSVYRSDDDAQRKTPVWIARQSLHLSSSSNEELLKLVEQLQKQGLALSSMGWEFSPHKQEELEASAELEAIKSFQARIEKIAHTLGKKIGPIRTMNIGERVSPMRSLSLMAAPSMAQSKSNALPQISNEEQDVTATVSGTVLLTP
ncbi:SIMPL domain-containing protein [Entomobacter blattae]|uniref:SIMPL domain-containing protein n=1 Tax=Entomobacter blattae TaxID=2762277 RepID=A0A7H1NUS5_9PROT|nr:SIMPL domain-containing protein [Entomobacter blattae]QNT79535.1 hypothetical protein JGUZn3_23350 [Entomobacter blattae]